MQPDPGPSTAEPEWSWDPSLYAGSAAFYAVGRVPYPRELVDALVAALTLDGTGRLLDVGCGPGSLTLLLAPYVAEAIGIDADRDMITEAERLAEAQELRNVSWRRLRGEDLPDGLLEMRLITFAQSFHWMDRPRVATTVREMLEPGGAVVHVHATTHEGIDTDAEFELPQPPREAISQLVRRYLGPHRRAGQGVRPTGTPGEETAIYRAAGFSGPEHIEVPGRVLERTADEVVAAVYSLSSSAPHLFGDRLGSFDAELRQLLADISPNGRFSQQMRSTEVDIWR